jgi:voltage-gated potassium channel
LGGLLTAGLQGASVLVAIGGRATTRLLLVLLLVLASIGVTGMATGSVETGIRDFLNAVVIAVVPVIILVRFRRVLYVNVQTVLGAVCIYLVIGMLFASFDSGLSHLSGRPFFAGVSSATSSQYMYFSFVTLTTVGYGDLTPQSGAARALAVSEGLMGQLYLVTVLALLVGSFGRSRQPTRGSGG